jgi:hypothetical protein
MDRCVVNVDGCRWMEWMQRLFDLHRPFLAVQELTLCTPQSSTCTREGQHCQRSGALARTDAARRGDS